jgi:hypothetical protein
MINPASFRDLKLHGGFILKDVVFATEPMLDALNREALAKTTIIGQEFRITLQAGLSQEEISVSLYHEILEAATLASLNPPQSVIDFNEGDFEQKAIETHGRIGEASLENLNRMLQFFGF